MKFILAAIFLFLLSGAAFSQDDILSKTKWGMSGDELISAFKDKGIANYTYSDNDDNNNSDNDNDNDDNNNRSGYRISNYSIDGNSYSVRFSMNHNKLKEIRFTLNKNDKALDIYEGWKKTFNSKFGNNVHENDFSGYGRTQNERAWEGSVVHVELNYFSGNGRTAMDITYSRD
ncbi:MAG: hypothetical protein JST55_01290 [Bacteroidetes bacterium]|nr:hypothetical protein [Bacteroidota bacterium]